jgi:sugar lactone lactonase YvrE
VTAPRRFRSAVLVAIALAAPASADDAPVACQHAIALGGDRYATEALRVVRRCAHARRRNLAMCVDRGLRSGIAKRTRRAWGRAAARACAGIDVGGALGYLDTCAPASSESQCTFASERLDARGAGNDLLDCLACQIGERLRGAGVALFASRPVRDPCAQTIGEQGMAVLAALLDELHGCLEAPTAPTIAACLADPDRSSRIDAAMASWRTAAEASCAGADPFERAGYPHLCAGVVPVLPPDCSASAPPCAFVAATSLSTPGADDDLLDCLACQVEEAALGTSRDLHGAAICCTSAGCPMILSRAGCAAAGGHPVHYRLDAVDETVTTEGMHGIAVGDDGTLYLPGVSTLMALPPGGPIRDAGPLAGFTIGLAVDPAGTVWAALREGAQIVRITADGTATPFAGTGAPGHSGDGGPATAAETSGPDGVAVDADGNVYFTESGAVSAFEGKPPLSGGEHVRMVDPSGTIHTIAGAGGFGAAGVDGPALAAELAAPYSIAALADRTIVVGEAGLQRVLRIDPSGVLRLVAGRTGALVGSYAGDGGPATRARLYGPEGLAEDSDGKLFIADMRNRRIRVVDRLGSIVTIAGTGMTGPSRRGPAEISPITCPLALAVGPDGRVYYPSLTPRVLTPVPY